MADRQEVGSSGNGSLSVVRSHHELAASNDGSGIPS